MKKAFKRIAAAAASLAVAASICAGTPALTASAAYGQGGNGSAIMEYLDRGIYAIKSGNGMFISWRFNANDSDDTEFRLYRDNTLIYTSKAGQATNYWDASGNSSSKYRVDTVVNGTVKSSDSCNFTSGNNYFEIPLKSPGSIYSPNDCCVGDVDGDGQYELFLKWDPSDSKDNSQTGNTSKVYIDCYTLTGKQLWRIDMGVNIRAGQHYTQMSVADFDCDGKAELITKTCDGTIDGTGKVIGNASANYVDSSGTVLTGPEYLTLFEGATGKALDTIDFPVPRGTATGSTAKSTWGDNYGNRCERYNSGIAYLDGVHPSAVYGRGYYTRLTLSAIDVKDGKLSKKWVYDTGFNSSDAAYGCGNHNLMVADFDNDGKQEVCMGASCFDDNGKLLWSTKQGHGDAMHVGDLDPNHAGIEVFICHEESPYGISLIDGRNGNKIWHYDGDKDTGRCCADNIFNTGTSGAEFWGSRPANAVYDVNGKQIGSKAPAMNFLIYWDGDLERELLNDISITKMTSLSSIQTIFTADGAASNNGTKAVPCLTADIFGDWREELVLRSSDNSKLRVYCTNTETSYRMTTLMHDMQYRMQAGCEQSSYNQPPHVSYYLGSETGVPARPNIKLNNTPAEPVSGNLVKNLVIKDTANAAGWQLLSSNTVGGLIYGDRDFTYSSLSSELQNCEYIMSACDSKNTDSDLASFTAGKDSEVYVLVDTREEDANSVPSWLSGYTRTSLTATSSNGVTFVAYKKNFKSGEQVVLGTNGMTGTVINYTVFVKEAAQEPVNGNLVRNFIVKDTTNAANWQLVNSNYTGGLIYGDRDFTYTYLADELNNCEYIRTACDSKNTDADLAEFTVSKEAEVYVLVDTREEAANSVPSWLNGYTRTSLTANSSNDVSFVAYKKKFYAGEKVVLGTNGMTGSVMNYTVFVREPIQVTVPSVTYPTNIQVTYSEQYHQVRFTWDKVENAQNYGIAVYLAGKWRIQTQSIPASTLSYTSPKNMTPGMSYKVAIAAKVNGTWDVANAIKNAVFITVA
ncbi:MAG: rhamnogalacturonan lyase [Ruminococcus albus]|nr:rhamnogalacturonan lyase [Ruminococcus albus]